MIKYVKKRRALRLGAVFRVWVLGVYAVIHGDLDPQLISSPFDSLLQSQISLPRAVG